MRLPALALLMLCATLVATGVGAQSDATPPLPDRNPMRPSTALAVPPKPVLPGEVPTEPWTDAEVTAAKVACNELLAEVTADYQPLPPIKEGICGAPAPVLLRSIGKDPKVVIDPPATLTCPMVKKLSDWLKDTVQPEAKAQLDSTVVGLHNATSYACRNRYGGTNTPLSEHALANALDVSEFVFATGVRVTVLDSWPKAVAAAAPPAPTPNPTREQDSASTGPVSNSKAPGDKPVEVTKAKAVAAHPPSPPPVATEPPVITAPKSLFLKHVHDAACNDFGTVLGPEANEAHKNHFHLDMKKRRSGYCDNGSIQKP
jgi:hypothetical protein